MSNKNISSGRKSIDPDNNVLFTKANYKWMIIGVVLVILGCVLMAGGKSADPNVFREEAIYGFRRITLAPVVILAGFVIEVYAIMKRPKIS